MSKHERVVWDEGMFLAPQHFQHFEAFLGGEARWRQEAFAPHAWGVRHLAIDVEALAGGRAALLELEAVLPDGTVVRAPAVDPLPPSRPLEDRLGSDQPALDLHLALPDTRPGVAGVRLPEAGGGVESRYNAENITLTDANRPDRRIDALVARQNLRLVLGDENRDGLIGIKLAEIELGDEGRPRLRRGYAPPSLAVAAAGPLPDILRGMAETLGAKSDAIAAQTRQRSGGIVEFSSSDVGNFWLLHTVNSFLPPLAHYQRTPGSHPLAAYLCLAQLAGALCTFGAGRHPRDLPPYEHEDLGGTFQELDRQLRELLGTVMPTRYAGIPLAPHGEDMLVGEVADERLLAPATDWYLGVHGDLPEPRIRDEVPAQMIIGSPHNVDFLVRTATPGVRLVHTPVPPRDFPLKAGRVYFRLEKSGETWETVREARSVAIYLGGPELRALSLELIATTSEA